MCCVEKCYSPCSSYNLTLDLFKVVFCDPFIVEVISSYITVMLKIWYDTHEAQVGAAHAAMQHHTNSKPVTDIRPEQQRVSSLYSQVWQR